MRSFCVVPALAGVVSCLSIVGALAADPAGVNLMSKTSAWSWDGWRVGFDLRYSVAHDSSVDLSSDITGSFPSFGAATGNSFGGGIKVRYDRQWDNFLIGLGLELSGGGEPNAVSATRGIVTTATRLDRRVGVSIVPRFGYATDKWVGYVEAGVDLASLQYRLSARDPSLSADLHENSTRAGLVLGVGVEARLADPWTIDIGYRNTQYGSGRISAPVLDAAGTATGEVLSTKAALGVHTVHIGLNYKF